jgi:hypothetical protein
MKIMLLQNWRLQVILPDRFQAVVDSTFVGDKLEKIAGKWRMRGTTCVILQATTACDSGVLHNFAPVQIAPEAETKLYALQQQ